MKMTKRAKQAGLYFVEGYNCAQAVAIAFADELHMDKAVVARLASSFGGGMGRMREVCGAVSGALMVLGYLRGTDGTESSEIKMQHYARVQEFAKRFKALHGTILCRELLENVPLKQENTPMPEERTEEYYKTRPCTVLVEDAVMILEQLLEEGI